jgi:hypothetical protein
MDVQTFIMECLMRGIILSVDVDALRVEHDGNLKPATADFIRQHKAEIIEILTAPLPHGPCCQCGSDTDAILTRSDKSWGWMCVPCFDRGARALPEVGKALNGELVRSI